MRLIEGGASRYVEIEAPATAAAMGWRLLLQICGCAAAIVTAVLIPMAAAGWLELPAKARDVSELQREQIAMRQDIRELKLIMLRMAADLAQIEKTPTRRPARPPLRANRIEIGL